MFKKLNNKGMTLVEVVVCFALVTIVLVSMYNTVSVYKTKQNIASYKETVTAYKNLLTKEIQDDLIKKGLVSANANISTSGQKETYKVEMLFKDGSTKTLTVEVQKAPDAFEIGYNNSYYVYLGDMNRDGNLDENDKNRIEDCKTSSDCSEIEKQIGDINKDDIINDEDISLFDVQKTTQDEGLIPDQIEITVESHPSQDDSFKIEYGDTTYPFPDLGSSKNDYGDKVYDLRINTVEISTDNNILSIYIGFYHPELLSRYAIDIACPINYF